MSGFNNKLVIVKEKVSEFEDSNRKYLKYRKKTI